MKAAAWKSAHVMAASLIQATLVDYLASAGVSSEAALSRMPLAELLDLCRREQVLAARTVELASFLRPYSDFLSPVQRIRLEAATDETGARIAQALLEIVINEISGHRRETYQYSAEKVVAKLQSDSSSTAIIGHLLGKLSRTELERLLTDQIPKAYFEAAGSGEEQAAESLPRLEACFRRAFETAPEDMKRAVAARFLSVLENESEFAVQAYQGAFFRGSDLEFLDEEARSAVKTHFLASLSKQITPAMLNTASGIGRFLQKEDEMRAFFVPLVMRLLRRTEDPSLGGMLQLRICEEFARLSPPLRKALVSWMDRLRVSLEREGKSAESAILAGLASALPGAASN